MRSRQVWKVFFAGALALAGLWGCGGQRIPPAELRQGCLVFGGINMDDAPSNARKVVVKAVAGAHVGTLYALPVKDGVFFHEGLPLGSYQLFNVQGCSACLGRWVFGSTYVYNFDAQADGFRVTKQGSILYVGSFKIAKAGGFFSDKFSVQPDKSRPVKDLVRAMVPKIEDDVVKDRATRWLALFK